MNDLYDLFTHSGFTPLNTALLAGIAFLARQRINTIIEDVECNRKRLQRLESSCYKAGIELIDLEE